MLMIGIPTFVQNNIFFNSAVKNIRQTSHGQVIKYFNMNSLLIHIHIQNLGRIPSLYTSKRPEKSRPLS